MPRLGDADRVRLRESVNSPQEKAGKNPCFRQCTHFIHARHALSAGVQTMRARICSALSCDMFARVAWLRLRRAAKPPTFTISFAARTRHAWLARLTRARGGCFLRGRKALLNDFWYFWSHKSTIKEKLLYDSIGSSRRRPLQTKTQAQPTAKTRNQIFHPLFLLHIQAQKKKLSKRKRREGIDTYAKHVCRRRRDGVISHSAECDKGSAPLMAPPFKKKAGENFN